MKHSAVKVARHTPMLLDVKGMNAEKREITGMATTPSPDRVGDIVEPGGAKFSLPIPLLWGHESTQPIGHVTRAEVMEHGIHITAKLAKVNEPGRLRDRLDEAWQTIKSGLVKGLSIGFKPIKQIEMRTGFRITEWEWLELSAVAIPANADAGIESIRAMKRKRSGVVRLNGAGCHSVVRLNQREIDRATAARRGVCYLDAEQIAEAKRLVAKNGAVRLSNPPPTLRTYWRT